ncbi:EAL domain-containing protein [Gloeobacter kilaueensis]|uniref:EAL domain-containing protein n=1 Tax=Gloeobacter kilaueensis TaxID=1416614 RepID=UPI0016517AF9|nr:EAL domain-containing protein [Gloeobacter kilaueensis]
MNIPNCAVIQQALLEDRFELWFQPVYRAATGAVVHNEALLRLRDGDGGVLLPGRFLPLAEQAGLMRELDLRVIEKAIAFLQQEDRLCLSVNLSGESLADPGFAGLVIERLGGAAIAPERLGFELKEKDVLADLDAARTWIAVLKKFGCPIALDDFGFNLTACEYLRDLPVDVVKIDGRFIRSLKAEPLYRTLVQAMNSVVHACGKRTLAESVEDAETLGLLRQLKVDYLQGYHLKRPDAATTATATAALRYPARVLLALAALYLFKSALNINLFEDFHLWELPLVLLRWFWPNLS